MEETECLQIKGQADRRGNIRADEGRRQRVCKRRQGIWVLL